MSTNDVTAPGRSALWTEAALRALTGAASREDSTVLEDVRAAFEQACLKQHAEEQEAERARAAAKLAEDTATILHGVKRYRARWGATTHMLTVKRVDRQTVYFEPLSNGTQISAPLVDVIAGEGFEPVGPEGQE